MLSFLNLFTFFHDIVALYWYKKMYHQCVPTDQWQYGNVQISATICKTRYYDTYYVFDNVVPNAWLPRDRKEVPRREIVSRIDPSRNWQVLRIRNKHISNTFKNRVYNQYQKNSYQYVVVKQQLHNNNHTFRCASTIMLQRIKQLSNQCIPISMQTVHVRYIQWEWW